MDRLKSVLTEAYERLSAEPELGVIDWLATELGTSFDEAITGGDLEGFQTSCRSHPLSQILLMDPYARRAFEKPRGYAGDAVMLDYIYRPVRSSLDGLTGVIHEATTSLPNAKSILWRQDYLANLIKETMISRETAEVLSVASGHMRELDRLRDITRDTNVRFTALDQDPASIAEARATYGEYAISGETKSFASLIRERVVPKRYNLIYSAGLFDYLQYNTAIALIKAMFARLEPGGVLSIANFTRDSHGRGFMAGFMDWCLVYRNEEELRSLADAACPKASHRIFRDQPRNVVYLEVFADRNEQ
ncbi:class I SAM-dependent methyltransferase [Methylobacterium sp. J-070]|uniref:class I SAM-dependent methyltransferase n=1 Tax=Methylobacterium sp. J-070 TaxID=2836650 RepID=UPI001FBAB3A6|nr:class I SAM-dependent methyltransferase [Methylobacterium sp. J-070]MCJ2050660.1 class I SAM-dependent methyltransferase [Methylobacterium sp. J-070]